MCLVLHNEIIVLKKIPTYTHATHLYITGEKLLYLNFIDCFKIKKKDFMKY